MKPAIWRSMPLASCATNECSSRSYKTGWTMTMIRVPQRQALLIHPLTTPRLLLRPLDLRDAKQLHRAVEESREYLAPWLPWVAHYKDVASAQKLVQSSALEWDQHQAFRFAIYPRNASGLLGVVALELIRPAHACADLGYWLRQNVQGQGVMTEASQELLKTAFEQWGFHRIAVAAATSNHPSLAVIARLGFRFEGIAREAEFCAGRWLDHARFGMLARDFPGT